MAAHARYQPKTALGRFVHSFEENAIAVMLGLMVMLTFVNVIQRYVFNSMLIWGLEVVSMLFAWLVLFGIAYGFKITAHLGVDAITNVLPDRARRIVGLIAAGLCLAYAFLLCKGAWDFWAPFASLDQTSGRWFPTGFTETRTRAFFETDQVPMPFFLRWLEDAVNEGETYSKLPRLVPYTILPIAAFLILFRIVEATIRILKGEQDSLIVSHEAEDAVEEAAAKRTWEE